MSFDEEYRRLHRKADSDPEDTDSQRLLEAILFRSGQEFEYDREWDEENMGEFHIRRRPASLFSRVVTKLRDWGMLPA